MPKNIVKQYRYPHAKFKYRNIINLKYIVLMRFSKLEKKIKIKTDDVTIYWQPDLLTQPDPSKISGS